MLTRAKTAELALKPAILKVFYNPFSIFQIQFISRISSKNILLLLLQSFLKNKINVSLFVNISLIIQKIEVNINVFVKMPNGLI